GYVGQLISRCNRPPRTVVTREVALESRIGVGVDRVERERPDRADRQFRAARELGAPGVYGTPVEQIARAFGPARKRLSAQDVPVVAEEPDRFEVEGRGRVACATFVVDAELRARLLIGPRPRRRKSAM